MDVVSLKYIAMGLMAFALLGAAIGVGLVFSASASAAARNPNADKEIFKYALIGGAMAEAIGLLAFVVIIMLL